MEKRDLESDVLSQLRNLNCGIEEVMGLVGFMLSECFDEEVQRMSQIEILYNFKTAQKLSGAIFDLLRYKTKETNQFIEGIYSNYRAQILKF